MGLKQHPLRLRKQIPALIPFWAGQFPSAFPLVNQVPADFGRRLAVNLPAEAGRQRRLSTLARHFQRWQSHLRFGNILREMQYSVLFRLAMNLSAKAV
jgi:hypothetical protein